MEIQPGWSDLTDFRARPREALLPGQRQCFWRGYRVPVVEDVLDLGGADNSRQHENELRQ